MASSLPRLSLCMIVKNEEVHLPRCLASARPYVDEIILVDTGSTDRTVAIAQDYGAEIHHFEWCNDFAAARNVSLSHASGDWILVLDADEALVVSDNAFRAQLATETQILAYSLKRTDILPANEPSVAVTPLYAIRLFRNLPDLRYTSCFHEYLIYQGEALRGDRLAYFPSLELSHYGYQGTQLQTKNAQRNIPLLEAKRQTEGLSLMLLATLANFYLKANQTEQAQSCFDEALERLGPNLITGEPPDYPVFIPYLLHTLTEQALRRSDYETARFLTQRGLEWFPTFPPLNYLTGNFLAELGFTLGSIPYLKYCLQLGREGTYYRGEPFDLRFMTLYPAYTLGRLYATMQRGPEARSYFELALSFDPSFELAQQGLDDVNQMLHGSSN